MKVLRCPECNEICEKWWVDCLGNYLCENCCWTEEDLEE